MAWGVTEADWLTGKVTTSAIPVPGPKLPYDTAVVRQLAAGLLHNLVSLDDGTVWAWGANYLGQLGDDTTRFSSELVRVAALNDVAEIAAGLWHSLARKADGTLWAWGDNAWGQLGVDNRHPRIKPVEVKFPDDDPVTAIAAGAYHSLAITTATDTIVWAWGQNFDGQLGPNTGDKYSAARVRVIHSPTGVTSTYLGVAGGAQHSMALSADGEVLAWGRNNAGQLGDGLVQDRTNPQKVLGPPWGQDAVSQIAAGLGFSLALASGQRADQYAGVWAWGGNEQGMLGDGTTATYRPVPVRVVGPGGIGYLSKISAIAAGTMGTSLALDANGTVWGWGRNSRGELGNGSTTPSNVPVQVNFGPDTVASIKHIAAGFDRSLAAGLILP